MRKLLAITVMAGVVAGAVALDAASPEPASAARLRRFASCAEVERWFQEGAERSGMAVGGGDDRAVAEDSAGGSAAPASDGRLESGAQREADFSGTNLQEEAVDEPDVVKTDGRLLLGVAAGVLHVVDARSARSLATLDLPGDPGGEELLLRGSRAIVISRGWRDGGGDVPVSDGGAADLRMVAPGEDITRLVAVDLSNPSDPTVTATAELDGSYVSARMTQSSIRLVLTQWPQVVDPAAARAEEWLPSITLDDAAPEPLADCDDVRRSGTEPASSGTTSVVTLDADGSLQPEDVDVIAAMASTVYASERRLYVASQTFSEQWPGDTDVHAFDTTVLDNTLYLGSGRVNGYLLSQWALSEHEGVLRVASTNDTDSRITTFVERSGSLVQAGLLTGLGPTERIYAVRYMGDLAYVVTFRQVDPLYTIDLSDPANPRTLGELKITGFSSYLHPVGPGRMLGVGQEATEEGMQTGTAVSLFDVSDDAAPRMLDRLDVPGAHSMVEWDHKAFTWWAPTSTAVVPFDRYTEREQEAGALVIQVGADEVAERGRVSHVRRPGVPREWMPTILRSTVVGPTLWTFSEAGFLASDLSTLADRAWIDFPEPEWAMGGPGVPAPMPVDLPVDD